MHHAKDIDVVMPVYNLIDYSVNYSKTFGSLWQYYRDEPFINNNGDDLDDLDSVSFKSKQKITGLTGNDGTKIFKYWYH